MSRHVPQRTPRTLLRGAGRVAALCALALVAACSTTTYDSRSALPSAAQNANARPDQLQRARAHTDLAAAYYGLGNYAVALEELQIALDADSSYPSAHNMLGLVYLELRDTQRAQQAFDRALRLAPDDPDVNHNYGWFLCQSGREQESLKYFNDAVRNPLYRTPARTLTTAGVCMLGIKRTDDAFQYLDRATRLDPNYAPAMIPFARVRLQRGELEEARALAQRFNVRGAPTSESIWLALLIERRRGDAQAEESFANMLRRRFPDSKEAQNLQRGQFE